MRTGVTVAGIVVLIVGLIVLGASSAYASFGGEVGSLVVIAIGVITTVAGAALKRNAP